MDLRGLIDELKRRRVTRVAGVYIVAAFAALQAADLIVPRLLLPDWVVTLVLVLALLGFPIAVGMAWALEVTPDGIRRTTPSSADKAGAGRTRIAFAAMILVAVSTAGWFVLRRAGDVEATTLNSNLLAVMPFRVQGADPSLAYLREGMMDLLSAKLTATPRAVDVRAVMGAYDRAVRNSDPTPEQAAAVARHVGAGRLVVGGIVGSPSHLTINVTLHDARTGRMLTDASDAGPADSLTVIVDRVVATLLGRELRESEQRLQSLSAMPFPTVRLYLEGKALYRRGNYDESAERFSAALNADSTFVLAALGLMEAANMMFGGDDIFVRGIATAWAMRDRLSAADQAYLQARAGPHYPDPSTLRERLNQWEQLTRDQPDRAEVWYEYADILHHRGPTAGVPDFRERSDALFKRALDIDPGLFPALQHIIFSSWEREDADSTARLTALYLARDSVGNSAEFIRLINLMAQQDWDELDRRFENLENLNHDVRIGLAAGQHRWNAPRHAERMQRMRAYARRVARGPSELRMIRGGEYSDALSRGRPTEAARLMDAIMAAVPDDMKRQPLEATVRAALFWEGDSAQAQRAAASLAATLPASLQTPVDVDAACALAQWRITHDDTRAEALAILSRLRSTAGDRPTSNASWRAYVCALILDATHAVMTNRADAAARVMTLDSVVQLGPPIGNAQLLSTNMTSARLLEMTGETQRAYAAIQRSAVFGPGGEYYLAPRTRERARLAAATGDRDNAIKHYLRFLEWRDDAEPAVAARDQQARAALQALTADRR